MKLYATTTSERASKGQGGNKYIDITLKDKFQLTLVEMSLYPETTGKKYELVLNGISDDVILTQFEKPKGKKQKGELCNCGKNPGFHEKQNNCI